MVVTGPAELLATWETGLERRAAGRALLLHRAARPEATAEQLDAEPLGARVADLLVLRRALFGERMQVLLECAACGEVVEFDLDARGLGEHPRPTGEVLRVAEGGVAVEFRLPTAADLDAVAAAPVEQRGWRLLEHCTLAAERDGEPVEPARIPEQARRQMAELAEQADPAADLAVTVHCPHCGGSTPTVLDIADFLWAELDSWSRDVLLDVHLLASAYGWSEPWILALSPLRRRYYLELCADG
ncbi:hypothetical protein OOZ19_17065 [Saccharopolyspora sp. NFXS83]|uniref:T4 family baseplate hub assembly chaperone n=1 Tax=Saccharopolyspora sp. NFXS83 TaxID=2993560 RepID=UPI00224A5941|nr:hypothetical protein [Saccharopolyspora sp. NFXS83]MCX2731955.1 hypothetical protein [Saccharopolyspora sp. NFXS83]